MVYFWGVDNTLVISFWLDHIDPSLNHMMTSSNGNIFRVTSHLCGQFTAQRPVTQSFGVFFDLRMNQRLSKQSWGWWFETLSRPLWRHRNDMIPKTGCFLGYDYNIIPQNTQLGGPSENLVKYEVVFIGINRNNWIGIRNYGANVWCHDFILWMTVNL